jgi:hypothetical protein
LAEGEEDSPFPALHVSRGYAIDDSTVTLLGVEGPHSLIFTSEDVEKDGDKFLHALAIGFASPVSNNIYSGRGNVAAILNPTHAQVLARSGFTRETARERIFELAVASRASLFDLVGDIAKNAEDIEPLRIVKRPEDILLLVSGGEGGGYSSFFPTWARGPHGNVAITKRIRIDEGCEIPRSIR